MGPVLLAAVVLTPLAASAACFRLGSPRSGLALRLSVATALALVACVSLTSDVTIPLFSGRALVLESTVQLGIQLLGLAMLGFVLSLVAEPPTSIAGWLAIAWLSLGGLIVALLLSSLPLAVLVFLGATLLWPFGLSAVERAPSTNAVMRFAALLALTAPLLLASLRLAELRTSATPDVERAALALAVPAFGLVMGLIPLHAWVLTLASGTPRTMLFGVLLLVQTAAFGLVLRTLATYPWMTAEARHALVIGGALSACVGGWLALSARRDDPDDWLIYATVANGGVLLAGLGTQSKVAGAGVALLWFARVLALVVVALAPRVAERLGRLATAAGTLALAGTPGLAGFPGLWLILRRLQETDHTVANLAVLVGCGLLFATAVRRWRTGFLTFHTAPAAGDEGGARRAVIALIALMVLLGMAPQVVAEAFANAMRDMPFPKP